MIDAREISRMLAEQVQPLVRELLPQGRRHGAEWVHASLSGTSTRSLSVHLTGAKAGVWGDFAAGISGDALDLVAHVRFGGSKRDAIQWAKVWLGISSGAVPQEIAPRPRPAAPIDDTEEKARKKAALRLFLSGTDGLRGTPAAHYLAARGIDLADLARQPRSLRFAPAVFNTETNTHLPAMLAAIVAPGGGHTATHRTWLAQDPGGVWRKAPLLAPKKVLGSMAGGSIRLWRGRSKKPLENCPETDTIVIAEGIETGLSVALACPENRVLCAISLSNLGRIVLPPQAIDIIIAADNDIGNLAAEKALERAVEKLLGERRSVRIARSSVGSDFNDRLVSQ